MIEQAYARYAAIPAELKALRNWCVVGNDKQPVTIAGNSAYNSSINKPEDWMSFDEAIHGMVLSNSKAIGFVLTTEAGFTCIDLDVKNEQTQRMKGEPVDPSRWTKPEDFERFQKIVNYFNTYSETSISGWGAHLWLRGRIGVGAKRDGVEVYSQERFIICTGNAFINEPIKINEEGLDLLVKEVRGDSYRAPGILVEVEQTESDETILERAASAGNADKFLELMRGEWQGKYPSQSEADLALMSMFTFYSKSNEQCRRLFRASGLGQREKATKNDRYLNYTLEVIRGRQEREAVIDQQGEALARALVQQLQGGTSSADIAAAQMAVNTELELPDSPIPEGSLDWPPGVAGALAKFIFASAPRPVKEIAIIASLGFFAGVAGKAYNVYNSGINLYLILVARSGVGKEAIHSGISLVCEALNSTGAGFDTFIDFTEYASGPALRKGCASKSSFLNICGEWGRKLRRLAHDDSDGPMSSLRTEMTNLYQKSGRGNMVGGMGYSNKEQNISAVTGVAYSMLGETTPETFYTALTPSMMEDGFLSRFIIIEYQGERPPLNKDKSLEMHKGLLQGLSGLCAQAIANNQKNHVIHVQLEPDAEVMLTRFDKECDSRINSTTDESVRQMWNRAHLKTLRIAAVLAVADNSTEPVITLTHAEWALDLVRRDIAIMNSKIKSGDVGAGDDDSRVKKLINITREYYKKDKISSAYLVPDGMRENGICPHRYLQMRTSQVSQFRTARQGSKRALEDTIRVMVDNGYFQEVPKDSLLEKYAYGGRAYRVLSLPE